MRILIIDDHFLFREGLAGLLREQPDTQVAGEGGSVHEAIEMALEIKPDVVLMDFSLPDGTGLDATRAILAREPGIKIVFLTAHDDDERLLEAVRAGARGYLLKNLPVNKLLASLRALERGEAAISRKMMTRIMDEYAGNSSARSQAPNPLVGLTMREIDVLKELIGGHTNQDIADHLFISENTVKNHIHNILEKLNLRNRREAIDFARKNGIR